MNLNLFKLGLTSFFTDISTEMIYPFLGIYFSTLGASPFIIGIIEGIAEGLSYILRIFSGFISDFFQRRKYITIIGYSLSISGKFFIYIFNILFLVSLGRWLDRIGKAIRNSPRDALIAESVSEYDKGKAFGFHRFMDTLGALTGVCISFLVIYYFWDLENQKELINQLILLSLFPAFLGIIILILVKEEKIKQKYSQEIKTFFSNGIKEIKNNKNLLIFLLINFLFALSNSSDQFIFLKANEKSLDLKEIIISYFFFNLSYVIFSYPSGKLSDSIPRKYVIAIGYLIYSLTYFLIPEIKSFFHLSGIFFLYGMYKGIADGVEKAFLSDQSKMFRASVIGLQSTLYGIGMVIASIVGGWIWYTFNSSYLFYFDAFLSFDAFLLILFFVR